MNKPALNTMHDFSAISSFVHVVEAKSFRGASVHLGMTPSGVSRAVSRLEERLGARLLYRSTRVLRLTEDGKAFYHRCKDILAELDEAVASLDHAHAQPRGRLRIAMNVSVGRAELIPNLVDFQAQYPDIRLELLMSERSSGLIEDGIDCAICVGEMSDSSLVARKLGHFNNVLCAAPEYLARHGTPTQIDDIRRHRCISRLDLGSGRPCNWQFETAHGHIALEVDAYLLINDGESVIQAAIAGLGIIQMPYCLVAGPVSRGELQVVMPNTVSTGSPVWVVYPHRHLSARVERFIAWLQVLFERDHWLAERLKTSDHDARPCDTTASRHRSPGRLT